jgi:hypothetical protein
LSKNLPIEFSGKLPSSDDFNQLIDLDRSDAEEKKNSI